MSGDTFGCNNQEGASGICRLRPRMLPTTLQCAGMTFRHNYLLQVSTVLRLKNSAPGGDIWEATEEDRCLASRTPLLGNPCPFCTHPPASTPQTLHLNSGAGCIWQPLLDILASWLMLSSLHIVSLLFLLLPPFSGSNTHLGQLATDPTAQKNLT